LLAVGVIRVLFLRRLPFGGDLKIVFLARFIGARGWSEKMTRVNWCLVLVYE